MTELERVYCAEQIVVPPALPEVLKRFAKEVIRKQPTDTLAFAVKYFAKLSGAEPAHDDDDDADDARSERSTSDAEGDAPTAAGASGAAAAAKPGAVAAAPRGK